MFEAAALSPKQRDVGLLIKEAKYRAASKAISSSASLPIGQQLSQQFHAASPGATSPLHAALQR